MDVAASAQIKTARDLQSSAGHKGESVNGHGPPEVQTVVNTDDLEDSFRCGYRSWKPDCIQRFNTPRWLLACVSWFTFIQGFVVNGIIYVNLSAWERLYGLSSSQVAWIASSYDVSAAFFTLLFGYLGQFMHNGVILAVSAFCMGCGSFTMLLPHLLYGEYELGPLPVEYCYTEGNATDVCYYGNDESSYYYWFLISGQLLHGVGGAALYTLGITYIDDQIKITNTPVYIGIMLSFACLGPAMGYMFGGLFLVLYVDFNRIDEPIDLQPGDPRWVGAWWIGLLFAGCAAFTVSILMACFPMKLPSALKYRSQRKSQAYKGAGEDVTQREGFGKSGKDVWITIKYLFTNPVFDCLTWSAFIESGGVAGLAAFLPKVITLQFSKTPAEAAVWAGLVVVPGAAGGQLLGGLIPKWMNLRMRGLLMQCMICSLVGLALSFQFLLRCRTPPIAGVTVPYFESEAEPSFEMVDPDVWHPCNTECNCTTLSYDPVCGGDSIEYFTPCYAGCTDLIENEEGKFYVNCSCLDIGNNTALDYATPGICGDDCYFFGIFLFFFLIMNLVTFISSTGCQAATLRVVPDKQRSFAVGVQRTITRLLGNIPGPIIMGLVFDYACIIWQDLCGETGSCWIYDSKFVSEGLAWACVWVKGASFLGFLLAWILYKPPPEKEEGVNVVESDENIKSNGFSKEIDQHNDNADVGTTYTADNVAYDSTELECSRL